MALNLGTPTSFSGTSTLPKLASLTPPAAPAPVTLGAKAKAPTANITPPPTTLSPQQTAPQDLSHSYANVGGTIYNTQTQQKFSKPEDFFKDSGQTSFNNLKFNTTYTPSGQEGEYGKPPATPPPAATPPTNSPYTPQNQGTQGVSQGGIIGNLLNTAHNENPQVTQAREQLSNDQKAYGKNLNNLSGNGIDMSLYTGNKGLLQNLYQNTQQADQAALTNALTSQGQQISATQAAGNLNAPQFTQPGTAQVSPSQPLPQGGIVGGNSALNPLNNVTSIAQQVVNGQISPSQAYAMGGTVANWQGLLNQALQSAHPGFDQSSAQARYDSNQSVQGSQAQQQAAYQSAHQQAQALGSQLTDLINSTGVNPNDVNAVNSAIQTIASNVSSPQYKVLLNYLTDVASRYAQILTPSGGSQTDTVRSTAQGMLDSTASGQSIISVLGALDQQAQAVINSVKTPSTTGNPAATTSPSSNTNVANNTTTLGLF